MSLADFFSPIDFDKLRPSSDFYTSHLGAKIDCFTDRFPSLEPNSYDLALIGVLDDRGALNNQGCALGPDYVRERLYQLNEGNYSARIVDLGNIKAGKDLSDTYVALKMVVT
jgi:arginase family enzyme